MIHKSLTTTLNHHIIALQIAIYYIVSFQYYPRVYSQSLVQNRTQNVFRSETPTSGAIRVQKKDTYFRSNTCSEAKHLVQELNCSEGKTSSSEAKLFRS